MKRLITILLVASCLLCFTNVCYASSLFDEIMSLPDSETETAQSTFIDFDSLISDIEYYCNAWGSTFDMRNKRTISNNSSTVVLDLDGYELEIDNRYENIHPVLQVAYTYASPEGYLDYSSAVKIIALIAALEYDKPQTTAERSAMLAEITAIINKEFENSVHMTKYGITYTLWSSRFKNSYTISNIDEKGYVFTAQILTNFIDSAEPQSMPIPIYFTALQPGEDALVMGVSLSESTIVKLRLRLRGFDESGNNIVYENDVLASSGLELLNYNRIEGATWLPGDTNGINFQMNLSSGLQCYYANTLEVALRGYTLDTGEQFVIPESQLCWYSSATGYKEDGPGTFNYQFPAQEIFDKSNSFSLGIFGDYIYPEESGGIAGYAIDTVIWGELLDNYDIHVGDIILGVNNISLYDDPFAIEKAKAGYADGHDMSFTIQRNSELIEVVIPGNK